MPEVFNITGPPGTGKTTYLGNQARSAAKKYGGDGVVICSLTRAAATEIVGRDLPVPETHIGTLHALSFRTLDKPAIAETKMKQWNEEHPDLEMKGKQRTQIDTDFPLQPYDEQQKGFADDMYARMNLLRARRISRTLWPHHVRAFADTWQRWGTDNEYIDFTGLIEHALRDEPTAPGSPSVLLADEAQDYSLLEYALLQKWGAETEALVICADPDQAIYEWRGADPRIFLDHPVPEKNKRTLSQSYRVSIAVHAFASKWIRQISSREDAPYHPTDEPGEVISEAFTYKQFEPLLRLYEELEGSVMILASCEYMLRPLVKMLRDEGIVFHNPYRRNHGSWNPLQRRTKQTTTVDRILNFTRPGRAPGAPILHTWTIPEVMQIIEHLDSKRILRQRAKSEMKLLRTAALEQRVPEYLGDLSDGLEWFITLFRNPEDARACLNRDIVWYRNALINSKVSVYDYPLRVFEKQGPEALTELPRLIVGTIHSVKGGEADNVIMFPDLSPRASQQWVNTTGGRDGLVRVFYVGATRARKRLILGKACTRHAVEWN